MGLPLLRDAFKAVQAAPVPGSTLPSSDAGGLLKTLRGYVEKSELRVTNWRSQTSRLMKEIPDASEEFLTSGGEPKDIIVDLEHLRSEVENRIEKTLSLYERAQALAQQTDISVYEVMFGDPEIFLNHARHMNALMRKDIEIGSEFRDFLIVQLAELDPESRGGPVFDNGDDLIAYLNR